jgi:hypothetical protein
MNELQAEIDIAAHDEKMEQLRKSDKLLDDTDKYERKTSKSTILGLDDLLTEMSRKTEGIGALRNNQSFTCLDNEQFFK